MSSGSFHTNKNVKRHTNVSTVSRRALLQLGGLGLGGLGSGGLRLNGFGQSNLFSATSGNRLFASESERSNSQSLRPLADNCIILFLNGGPS
ncbi:hypothetical protein FJZ55_08415, partial [Candidatus Woesearchaeota archaeon]|nr:hypothetical protein [Candidatus Woesearchaeota archaeon]